MSYGLLRNKRLFERFRDDEFRNEYVSSRVRTRMAMLIKALRKRRGWTQSELAERARTKQSVISRIEDPEYEGTSLQAFFQVASAFKLPLWIDFPNWREWAVKSEELSAFQFERNGFDTLSWSDLAGQSLLNDGNQMTGSTAGTERFSTTPMPSNSDFRHKLVLTIQ